MSVWSDGYRRLGSSALLFTGRNGTRGDEYSSPEKHGPFAPGRPPCLREFASPRPARRRSSVTFVLNGCTARTLSRVYVGPRSARSSSVRRGVRFAAQPSWPRGRALGGARAPGFPHHPRALSTCAPMMCTFPLVLAIACAGSRQGVAPRDGAPPPPAPPPAATTPAPSAAAQPAELQPTRAPSAAEANANSL